MQTRHRRTLALDTKSLRPERARVIAQTTPHYRDGAQGAQVTDSSEPRSFASFALVSLLAHFCLALCLAVADDPVSSAAREQREIPVEVITAKPRPLQELSPAMPNFPPDAEPAKARAAANEKPDPRMALGQGETAKKRQPMRRAAAVRFDAPPYHFRAFALPAAAATGGEAENYQYVVGGMLERAKQYPESAIRRGAKGAARIGFVLDEFGGVSSVSLLRSSGAADLDSESVALVRRAAPYPPPPRQAKRSFAIEVAFGMKNDPVPANRP